MAPLALFAFFPPLLATAASPAPVTSPPRSPRLPLAGGPAGYLGSDSCQECHRPETESWQHSFHRSMTQAMTTNNVRADFDRVRLEFGGERFTLRQQANQFWVEIEDLDTTPASREVARMPMELMTGSHHMQVFWLPAGAGNAQIGFPFTWLIAERRWVPRESTFIRDPDAPPQVETWNMTCIRCHVTSGQPRPRREEGRFATRAVDLGIACESCHGPGADHAAFRRARPVSVPPPPSTPRTESASGTRVDEGGRRPAQAGSTSGEDPIVQPAKLEHIRSSHVCAQCHSIKWFDSAEGWVENGFRYRPGDDLEATTPVVRPGRTNSQPWMKRVLERAPQLFDEFFWPDGMIRVAGREFNGLLETACFQRGKMSCLSCHAMHDYASPDDQLKKGMESNAACLACHDAGRYDTKHSHHRAGSTGDSCYNCHMPHTTYALLKGVRQHQIDSPRVATTLSVNRPNACNLCHLDRTLVWTAERLSEWYGQAPVAVPERGRVVSPVVQALLAGDAGQRALAAWHLGWAPARAISGEDWQAPLLARLLEDPYSAVRHIAHQSLRQLPGYRDFAYDFVGDAAERAQRSRAAREHWPGVAPERVKVPGVAAALLLRPDGTSEDSAVETWRRQRDDRPMRLRE